VEDGAPPREVTRTRRRFREPEPEELPCGAPFRVAFFEGERREPDAVGKLRQL